MYQKKTVQFDRVRANTRPYLNELIDLETEKTIEYYASKPKEAINQRLVQLEQEWDIERYLEVNASSIAFLGCVLALTSRKKRWLVLPILVTGFLLQHGLQGWCPPLPLLRWMGVRTRREIDSEKIALKALRGDFDNMDKHPAAIAEQMT